MKTKDPSTLHEPSPEAPVVAAPNRRRFLQTAALSVAGGTAALAAGCEYKTQLFLLGGAPTQAKEQSGEWQEARIRSYRPLGRTGMDISAIC